MNEHGEASEVILSQEREIADYLHKHPEFFQRHEYLLEDLTLPHPHGGKAISLIERQVGLMREQKQALKKQLQQLSQSARTNEQLLERLQALILTLIDSTGIADAVERMRHGLRDDFHADAVELHLFGEQANETSRNDPILKHFQTVLHNRRPVCGHLRPEQLRFLFGERGEEMASAVLIPLCESTQHECLGLLGIGSIDAKRYHPEMGTLFVNHLGAVASRILRAHRES
jgi:uncharacterized protein YigA (DUF484 family)